MGKEEEKIEMVRGRNRLRIIVKGKKREDIKGFIREIMEDEKKEKG